MSKINRYFDTDIARDVGTDSAIILYNIQFWIEKNKANDKNFYDGRYWTYSSVKAFEIMFDWLSGKTIRTCLNKLEKKGYLITGNYNATPYDRTKWYSTTDKCDLPKEKIHLPKSANQISQSGEPIPYSNTDKKTDIIIESEKESLFRTIKYLIAIPEDDVAYFKKKFNCNEKQIINKGEQMYSYCMSHGKKYKDYRHTLRNALDKDFGLRKSWDELIKEENPGIVII